jgi:hypothetical protein
MSALFKKDLQFNRQLFSNASHKNDVGAYEGANYESTGYFRPQMQCIMFDRSDSFCDVCNEAINVIIDLYSQSGVKIKSAVKSKLT